MLIEEMSTWESEVDVFRDLDKLCGFKQHSVTYPSLHAPGRGKRILKDDDPSGRKTEIAEFAPSFQDLLAKGGGRGKHLNILMDNSTWDRDKKLNLQLRQVCGKGYSNELIEAEFNKRDYENLLQNGSVDDSQLEEDTSEDETEGETKAEEYVECENSTVIKKDPQCTLSSTADETASLPPRSPTPKLFVNPPKKLLGRNALLNSLARMNLYSERQDESSSADEGCSTSTLVKKEVPATTKEITTLPEDNLASSVSEDSPSQPMNSEDMRTVNVLPSHDTINLPPQEINTQSQVKSDTDSGYQECKFMKWTDIPKYKLTKSTCMVPKENSVNSYENHSFSLSPEQHCPVENMLPENTLSVCSGGSLATTISPMTEVNSKNGSNSSEFSSSSWKDCGSECEKQGSSHSVALPTVQLSDSEDSIYLANLEGGGTVNICDRPELPSQDLNCEYVGVTDTQTHAETSVADNWRESNFMKWTDIPRYKFPVNRTIDSKKYPARSRARRSFVSPLAQDSSSGRMSRHNDGSLESSVEDFVNLTGQHVLSTSEASNRSLISPPQESSVQLNLNSWRKHSLDGGNQYSSQSAQLPSGQFSSTRNVPWHSLRTSPKLLQGTKPRTVKLVDYIAIEGDNAEYVPNTDSGTLRPSDINRSLVDSKKEFHVGSFTDFPPLN